MTDTWISPTIEERIVVLATAAGLELTAQRIDAVKASVTEMWLATERVRAVDLGENAPAAAFDAEWV